MSRLIVLGVSLYFINSAFGGIGMFTHKVESFVNEISGNPTRIIDDSVNAIKNIIKK